MRFDVLTLFPDLFAGYLTQSILHKALESRLVEIHLWNIREWAKGKHKNVDDRPFGGGPGIAMWSWAAMSPASFRTWNSTSRPARQARLRSPSWASMRRISPRVEKGCGVPSVP